MLNDSTFVRTRLSCIANELELNEKTGDTDLIRLCSRNYGASIKTIAKEMNEDLVHICAIISAILPVPAVGQDGTYLQQHDMHGEPTPAHRSIPWNEFHKVCALTTRFLAVLVHAQTHHRS